MHQTRDFERTAADVLVETFLDWGVDVVFELPGDGINGIMESLRTHKEKIRFIQVRHEETAAFMAGLGGEMGYVKGMGVEAVDPLAKKVEKQSSRKAA